MCITEAWVLGWFLEADFLLSFPIDHIAPQRRRKNVNLEHREVVGTETPLGILPSRSALMEQKERLNSRFPWDVDNISRAEREAWLICNSTNIFL